MTATNEQEKQKKMNKQESKIKKFTPWNWTNTETNVEVEAPFQNQIINDVAASIGTSGDGQIYESDGNLDSSVIK